MRRDTVIALAVFCLAFWHFLANVPRLDNVNQGVLLHRDEARWIHRSFFIRDLFHPNSPTWGGDNLLTLGQPPLGNYIIGLGLLIQGRELEPNGFYDFKHNMAWNRQHGNVPSDADLFAARRTIAFVGALTVMLVFLIGRRLANRVAGVAGALLLIPHPLNLYLTTFAGSDEILICLVAAAALAAIALAERPTWWRAIILGALIGLGGATKLTPLLLALPLAALGAALLAYGLPKRLQAATALGEASLRKIPLWRRLLGTVDGEEHALGWMLLAQPIIAFATFVLIYPYLWWNPIGNTKKLFDFRTQEMESQAEIYPNTQVSGPIEALRRVRTQLGIRDSTANWLSEQLQERFNHTFHHSNLDIYFGFLGICLLAGWALMYGPRSKHALGGIVIAGEAALIIIGMQVDFNRYHLPILLCVAVGVGFFFGQVWNAISGGGRLLQLWWSRRTASRRFLVPALPETSAVLPPLPETLGDPSTPPAASVRSADSARRSGWSPASLGILAVHEGEDVNRRRPYLLGAALSAGLFVARAWLRLRQVTRRPGSSV